MKKPDRRLRGIPIAETIVYDLRHGVRRLAKSPGFALIAVISLALGIGANSATFSFADALLFRPLPVEAPDEVVTLGSFNPAAASTSSSLRASYPDYVDIRDRADTLAGITASLALPVQFRAGPGDSSEVRTGSLVSGDFFQVLGVEPDLGRTFLPGESEVPMRDAVAVLSYRFWQTTFASDPGILGRTVNVNGAAFTIVGVAPERFTGIDPFVRPDIYVPLMMWPGLTGDDGVSPLEQRDRRSLVLKGRLRDGASIDEARAQIAAISTALAETWPVTNRGYEMQLRTELADRLKTSSLIGFTIALLVVLGILVLLVACINVAGLLASRAPARAGEMSLRQSLGASRNRIVRQLLTENALLAVGGGLAGIGVGYLGIALWRQVIVQSDVAVELAFQVDGRFLLASLVVALVSVFLFGLAPALQTSKANLTGALQWAGRGIAGRAGWGRRTLVGGQVSLALVLIAVAAFMYTAFLRQVDAGPGVRIDDVLTMSFNPDLSHYSVEESQRFYERLIDRAREVPGVESAALASFVPMSGQSVGQTLLVPEGYQLPDGLDSDSKVTSYVDADYFEVMDVPLIQGRGFEATDTAESQRVAVVNELFANIYWPDSNAVGRRFRFAGGADDSWAEIVGVVPTGRYFSISETPTPFLFLPYSQHPQSKMTLVVQAAGDPALLAGPLRSIVRELDVDLALTAVRTMANIYYDSAIRNFLVIMRAIAAMGVIGVTLAFVGLFGLVATDVNRRTREIGIRMAVGASRGSVLVMVLARGLRPAVIGLAVGVVLMIGVSQAMTAAVPGGGGSERGLAIWFWVTGAVLAVSALAAYLPARRATHIGPSHALRHE
jgi:putative ABC transport system permease protein